MTFSVKQSILCSSKQDRPQFIETHIIMTENWNIHVIYVKKNTSGRLKLADGDPKV